MTKRAKIIIGVVIALLLAAAGAAAWFATTSASSDKSSNQIKADIQKAFTGKDYFKDVQVKTYAGMSEVTDSNAASKSAAIIINVNKMDSATFKDIAATVPDEHMTAFYSIGTGSDNKDHLTSVTGFRVSDLKDAAIVDGIANSLKVQETYQGSYWQISRGDASGEDATKMKTQFVAKSETVSDIRKTVDAVMNDKMDALPVAKTTLSTGSFVQFAGVQGKMDNYDKGVDFALQFASQTFTHGTKVTVLGLGNDIQISYDSLESGWDKTKLTQIADQLNKDNLFKVTINDPASATPSPSVTPSGTSPFKISASATATPSPSGK